MKATFTITVTSDRSDVSKLQADFAQLKYSLELAAKAVTGNEAAVCLEPTTFSMPYGEEAWWLQQCVDGHISVTSTEVTACPKCGNPIIASAPR